MLWRAGPHGASQRTETIYVAGGDMNLIGNDFICQGVANDLSQDMQEVTGQGMRLICQVQVEPPNGGARLDHRERMPW